MAFVKDLTGQTFGNLLVIERTNRVNAKRQAFWKCKCQVCGKYYEMRGDSLRLGDSKGCRNCSGRGGTASREII